MPGDELVITRCAECGTRLSDGTTICGRCQGARRRSPPPPVTSSARASAPTPKQTTASKTPAAAASSPVDDERRWLQLIGYLLVAGGFTATLAPGLWLGAGFVGVSAGCVLGLSGTPKARWGRGLLMGVLLSILGSVLGASVLTRDRAADANREPQPILLVTIRSSDYRNGELIVWGTVHNVGEIAVFSPAIELDVHEASSGTLVAAETAYPDDEIEAWLRPGDRASFEHLALIPDNVGPIEWTVTAEGQSSAVVGTGATQP